MITNYKLFSALSFVAGAAIGSVVTWKLVKTKYERIAQEEIDSVKEVFSRRKRMENEEAESVSDEESTEHDVVVKNLNNNKPDIMEYASKINSLSYTGSDKETEESEEESGVEEDMNDEPYVISADEFDEIEDYEAETLTYYADGVLTDWYNEVIDDVEDVVGLDALENFDKYAADGDTVYVRNDSRECDYEIQRDTRNYADVCHPR